MVALLLDREAANRNTRRFQIRLRSAKLRHSQAAIEDVDYRTPRRLDKALSSDSRQQMDRRAPQFARNGAVRYRQIVVSCASPRKACRDGYTVVYARLPRLFATWNSPT